MKTVKGWYYIKKKQSTQFKITKLDPKENGQEFVIYLEEFSTSPSQAYDNTLHMIYILLV